MRYIWETSRNKLKKYFVAKNFTACSSYLKKFANLRLKAENFKSFSRSVEQFFLTEGQSNFGNKIPISIAQYPDLTVYLWKFCEAGWLYFTIFTQPHSTYFNPGFGCSLIYIWTVQNYKTSRNLTYKLLSFFLWSFFYLQWHTYRIHWRFRHLLGHCLDVLKSLL